MRMYSSLHTDKPTKYINIFLQCSCEYKKFLCSYVLYVPHYSTGSIEVYLSGYKKKNRCLTSHIIL